MATCAENKVIADSFIVSMYPEIVGFEAFMDNISALGRLVFTVTVDDVDHGPAIEKELNNQLDGLGYIVTRKGYTVVVACSS